MSLPSPLFRFSFPPSVQSWAIMGKSKDQFLSTLQYESGTLKGDCCIFDWKITENNSYILVFGNKNPSSSTSIKATSGLFEYEANENFNKAVKETRMMKHSAQEQDDGVDNCNDGDRKDDEQIDLESGEYSCDSDDEKDITVGIESKALNCPVCVKPLQLPLLQCANGHVVCSHCCDELKQRFPSCTLPITPFRCLFLETIIASNRISCPYSRFGCQESIAYNLKQTHKDSCNFAPCICPILACRFKVSIKLLSSHLKKEHSSIVPQKHFVYGHFFKVSLHRQQLLYVLHGTDNLVFLFINSYVVSLGNHLSVTCIRPNEVTTDIQIELDVIDNNGSSLRLKGLIENIRKWKEDYRAKLFLNVPEGISTVSSDSDVIEVNICIRKT